MAVSSYSKYWRCVMVIVMVVMVVMQGSCERVVSESRRLLRSIVSVSDEAGRYQDSIRHTISKERRLGVMLCRVCGIWTARVFIVTLHGEESESTVIGSGVFSPGPTQGPPWGPVTGCRLGSYERRERRQGPLRVRGSHPNAEKWRSGSHPNRQCDEAYVHSTVAHSSILP